MNISATNVTLFIIVKESEMVLQMVYQKNRTWRVKFIQKAFLNTMNFAKK